ncbi:MAG: HDOD domain-containing protein [Pontibacterium sp.]
MAVGVRAAQSQAGGSDCRVVLMHDQEGKALVVLPSTSLLNLASVWKTSGRQLQPVKPDDAAKFFAQAGLQTEAGLAKLFSLPLFLDGCCSAIKSLEVSDPCAEVSWTVPPSMLAKAKTGVYSVAAGDLSGPDADDEVAITNAVKRFTQLRIQQRLEDTLGLPSMSPTMRKVLELRSDPEADVEDLVKVVRVDPSLSAQVMSWAASPYYAAPGEVNSIEDAVLRVLGFELVINMALGTAMGQMLTVPKEGPRGGTPYWMQAVCCATLAERLAKKAKAPKKPLPGLAYLAGLLHNFGYLVLAHLFPPHFALLSRYIEANPHIRFEAIEQQVLNVTREQIGGWLLTSWSLPEPVCQAVRYQNSPEHAGEYEVYANIIKLSNTLLRLQALSDGPIEDVPEELLGALGLSQEDVNDAMESLTENQDSIKELTLLLEEPTKS